MLDSLPVVARGHLAVAANSDRRSVASSELAVSARKERVRLDGAIAVLGRKLAGALCLGELASGCDEPVVVGDLAERAVGADGSRRPVGVGAAVVGRRRRVGAERVRVASAGRSRVRVLVGVLVVRIVVVVALVDG